MIFSSLMADFGFIVFTICFIILIVLCIVFNVVENRRYEKAQSKCVKPKYVKCEYCGSIVSTKHKTCTQCGAKLVIPKPNLDQDSNNKNTKSKKKNVLKKMIHLLFVI